MIIKNSSGLVFAFSKAGALRSIEVAPIRLSMKPPTTSSWSCANLYLRKRGSTSSYTPLLGAASPSRFHAADGFFVARGSWGGLDYECLLELSSSLLSFKWSVRIESKLPQATEVDVLYVQDVGLKAMGPGLVNEYYASQYLDRRIFDDPRHGSVVSCRQNMRESVGHPWLMIACASRAAAASTDGMQFYGRSFRATGEPEALATEVLGGELAGESSVVALQEQPVVLSPGASHTSGFLATYVPDHPEASSERDLARLTDLARAFASTTPPITPAALAAPVKRRFEHPRRLEADDLTHDELVALFGSDFRHREESAGELLSFFADGPRHVVLRAKEARVDRPHGHIMQTLGSCVPDERIMSTTTFLCGVFNSHITQGNTNFNTLLSVCTFPLAPTLEGQRIFVQLPEGETLLGVPSAFEMGLNACRWIYKFGATSIQVCTWTDSQAPRVHLDVQVLRGGPLKLTITHQFDDLNGWSIARGDAHEFVVSPHAHSTIAKAYPAARFRIVVNSRDAVYADSQLPDQEATERALFVLDVAETSAFCMSFIGEVDGPKCVARIDDADAARRADGEAALAAWQHFNRELTLSGPDEIAAIREILPWYGMNALIHFLTPYGLEQFSGAAWGTRDVSQGPIELLLCQEKYEQAKQVLRILFSRQSLDGGWPQWWMFDRYRAVSADGAHGDVIYWCVLALCSYLKASGDFGFLDERLPYFREDGEAPTASASVSEHVDRIFTLVTGSFVPGTALVQFGGGDWNDSLQPVSKDLARRLISSWTVQMCYQAFSEYRAVCEQTGKVEKARALQAVADQVLTDFNRYLVRDGVVAGYGLVGDDQTIDVLLHPSDAKTGVHYSLLPMNRGVISEAFTKEQAEHHLPLIERHLKGPDGARLMDRPLRYTGGPQTIFQRAESSTYFGREIGLMYVHEHLRYAETQARMGRPDAFLHALRQAIPVDYQEVVPQGDLRQSNCYYSSSDVLFENRYEADEHYDDVVAGRMPLKGGWRVYSSGPGIYLALVVARLLGLRIEFGKLIIDPVMPRSLDGLTAAMRFRGRPVTFAYRVTGRGFGPRAVAINGQAAAFDRAHNRYREGGAAIPLAQFLGALGADDNRVQIET